MQKYIITVVVIVVFGFAQNLLQNPGFEEWTAGIPDYWEKDAGIEIFQEDVIIHGGTYSTKDSLITQTQADADFSQTVEVQSNIQYTFSVWVYDNDPAGRIGIGIDWFPSGSDWPNIFSVDATEWQELTFTATSPADAEFATVDIRGYDISSQWDGDAIFYIDDASFEAPPIQPPIINRKWHTPTNPDAGVTEDVYAEVTDNGTIDYDTLYYGINNLTSPTALTHTAISNDTFQYQIPGQSSSDTVFYYLRFIDDDGLETFSDTQAYYIGSFGITINELYYDTPGSDLGCFIEIYGPGDASLDGFSLVGVNGSNGAEYATIDLTGYSIPSDGFFVVGDDVSIPNVDLIDSDANLQNGDDNVELRFYNITIDALGYGTLGGWVFTGEWTPVPDVSSGHCLGRYPDGYDTDNNYDDFYDYDTQTPGEPNPEVGVEENGVSTPRLPLIKNPIVSNINFAHIIETNNSYPIMVYNITGRMVKEVSKPKTKLSLPAGIYFLKLNNIERGCVKIVVVK